MTFALQVYVPDQYHGLQDESLLGTVWLGYIPTSNVNDLSMQIKAPQSMFYTGAPNTVARSLAQRVVAAYSILSVPADSSAGAGRGSNSNSNSNSSSNARRDAIIGVVSAVGGIAILVLGILVYRSYKRRRELAHRRISDPPTAGIAPHGRDFDQDSVGGARRRSFYWAEDSLRGYEVERGVADTSLSPAAQGAAGVVRRNVATGAISAPILRESSMNW